MPSFFCKHPPPTDLSPLPLHAALPISGPASRSGPAALRQGHQAGGRIQLRRARRSEEHTSELHSLRHLVCRLFFVSIRPPPISPLFPYTPLFRSLALPRVLGRLPYGKDTKPVEEFNYEEHVDRKSTRLNSIHLGISYAVFFL